MEHGQALVGIGLYTVPEATRLIRVPARRIRRWLTGYRTRGGEAGQMMPPVWRGQVLPIKGAVGLGFLDLMELRFVEAFRRHGVSLSVIRRAAQRAEELFQRDHPFTRFQFKTDGRGIFADIAAASGDSKILDLARSQYAFHRVVDPSLYASMEFSADEDVLRWYPLYPNTSVAVDPKRAFGRPIVRESGVPTDILAQAVEVDGSEHVVARYYEVPLKAVRAAVDFEKTLAA